MNTADGGKLVVMLYEGALKAINTAIAKMDYQNYDLVNSQIKKATDIINELMFSLDMEAGVISQRLKSIYMYVLQKLNEANMNKTPEELLEVKDLLEDLLRAWKSITTEGGGGTVNKKNPPGSSFSSGLSITG